jgi:hypothetical protein
LTHTFIYSTSICWRSAFVKISAIASIICRKHISYRNHHKDETNIFDCAKCYLIHRQLIHAILLSNQLSNYSVVYLIVNFEPNLSGGKGIWVICSANQLPNYCDIDRLVVQRWVVVIRSTCYCFPL